MNNCKCNSEQCNCNPIVPFLWGVFWGGVVGAVTALLLAPQSGDETRDSIKEISLDFKDRTVTAAEEIKNQTRTAYQNTIEKAKKILPEKNQLLGNKKIIAEKAAIKE